MRLADAGREAAVAVGEDGRSGGNAVGEVPEVAGRVALAEAHPEARIGVGVAVAVRERLARQPVLVVPPEARGLAAEGLRRQVAARVVWASNACTTSL